MHEPTLVCRPNCGACCIALSISAALPGLPHGKPAGIACLHLDPTNQTCRIYTHPGRPACCRGLKPLPDTCGRSREEALALLAALEEQTRPAITA